MSTTLLIKKIFTWFVDVIFPVSPQLHLMESVSVDELLRRERSEKAAYYAVFSYKDPLVRNMIWCLKYAGSKKCGEIIGEACSDELLEFCTDDILYKGGRKISLVPIPLTKEREEARGYNQSYVIAKTIADIYPDTFKLQSDFLIKTKSTQSQAKTKSKEERLINLRGTFAASPKVHGEHIVLIDDVFTTGATFKEACLVLRENGAKDVLCFAVAH